MSDLAGRQPGRLDLTAVQGDDLFFIAEVENQDGQPTDVTGWTLVSEVRETFQGALLVALDVATQADDPGLADNEVRVSASANQMADVGEGAWPWDLRRTAGGPSVRTLLSGTLLVRPNVTEA